MAEEQVALMPQAELDEGMLAAMRAKTGARLRIDHSVNNDVASRIAVAKFAGGIGDINPLRTDPEYGKNPQFAGPLASWMDCGRAGRGRGAGPGREATWSRPEVLGGRCARRSARHRHQGPDRADR